MIPPLTAIPPNPLRRSAETLEATFLAEMFKAANLFTPRTEQGGGSGEEQFTSFLADIQARALVARGGLGLADRIEVALQRRQSGGEA